MVIVPSDRQVSSCRQQGNDLETGFEDINVDLPDSIEIPSIAGLLPGWDRQEMR
jgi:hypothetical protein